MLVWQAKLSPDEEMHADEETLDEMVERLDKFWQELKDELIYA